MVRGLENDSQVRFAAARMYDLFRDRDTMRLDEYEQQMRNFAVDLQNALGIDFDLSGLFGIDDYSN